MVLPTIVSLAATERVTLQRGIGRTSRGPKSGPGTDIGIVEGWGGDEDEDVDIDSDDEDSGSGGFPGAAEYPQLQCANFGGSSSPDSSGMREGTEPSPGLTSNNNGPGSHTGIESLENAAIATTTKGVRLVSSSEGSSKRMGAREFRREFNVQTDSVGARSKPAVPDTGRMRGPVSSEPNEMKQQPPEKDSSGGRANKSLSIQPNLRTIGKKRGGEMANDSLRKGNKRDFRAFSREHESELQRSVKGRRMVVGEEFKNDSSKKGRFHDLQYEQTAERKYNFRARHEVSKHCEGSIGTQGHGDAGSIAKGKRPMRVEEVNKTGTSVPEKRTPSKQGVKKVGKSPALSPSKSGRQEPAVANRDQRQAQARGSCQNPSTEGEKSRPCLSGDGAKRVGMLAEASELDSLKKVFERRPIKRKDKQNGIGANTESKLLTGPLPADRRPTRSTERAEGAEKSKPGQEGSDKINSLPRTKSATVKGTIRVLDGTVEDAPSTLDRHVDVSGNELEKSGMGTSGACRAEKFNEKRKRSSVPEMENKTRLSYGEEDREGTNLEKESTESEGFHLDRDARSKKQKQTDDKVVAMPAFVADGDPNVAALADLPAKEIFPRHVRGRNKHDLEEGEIGSSDSDGKQESIEAVPPREPQDETRLGVREGVLLQEDSKNFTIPIVQQNEPTLSKIQLRLDQGQVEVEKFDTLERMPLSAGLSDGKFRAGDTSDIDAHFSPSASTEAGSGNLEPVVARVDSPQDEGTSSGSASHLSHCNERHSGRIENQIDELCIPEDGRTTNQEGIGGAQVVELPSSSHDKLARLETLDVQAGGEDKSDSEDGRSGDNHNSYCQYCRQGGELLCCDGSGCKITYHLECTDPKLAEVPSGNWYCPMCTHKRLSYGVHAVSKSVESIWDIRNRAQSSDISNLLRKDVSASDPQGSYEKDPKMRGRSMEAARRMLLKNRERGEDELIDSVAVFLDDQEGVPGIAEATSGTKRATQRIAESVTGLTERRQRDEERKKLENRRKLVDESSDKEYFVKWKGLSHAHNTWVGETELAKLSPKGLAKFKKKLAEGQMVQWNTNWAEPQRLVDKRVSIPPRRPGAGRGRGFLGMDTQQEWFVKWKSLGYEHCTWEPVHSGVLSDTTVQQLGKMFERWSEAARERNSPQQVNKADKLREANFKELQIQPDWIRGAKLHPNQLDRLNQLRQRWHHRQNTLIVDQDEQAISSTTVRFLLSLIEEYAVYKLNLVVVPAAEIDCWEAEIAENAPQVNTVVYAGGKEARGVIQRFELDRSAPLRAQVVLTTSDVAFTDFDYLRKIKWEAVVVDESQQFKTAKCHRAFLRFDAGFWLLFISELSKYNIEELQQIGVLFDPECSSLKSDFSKQLSGLNESDQLQYLKDLLSEHIVSDSRPDEASGLRLVEHWVGTNMTPLQIQLYCNTLTSHYNLLQSGRSRSDADPLSLHDFVGRLRNCCQHPLLVDPTLPTMAKDDISEKIAAGVEASEKWQLIHAMLPILHGHHQRVVILSQSPMMLFVFEDYLKNKYGDDSYSLVVNRNSPARKEAVQKFHAKDSQRTVFLLKTGVSGFSLKLKNNDAVIVHDSDLNPSNDLEYLRKVLHRVDGEVKVFRLYQHFTVEDGSRVYNHQKKLGPDPKPPSVKILHQLLRWKVQHILDLDRSYAKQVKKGKGEDAACLSDKATHHLTRVANNLLGNVEMESLTENDVDEVWTDEDGDSVRDFWCALLKDRYAELRDQNEQLNSGKGLRQRKKVQYSEEALAAAPYSVVEDEESRQKRRRTQLPESTSATQAKESAQVTICQMEEDNNVSLRGIPAVEGTARCESEVDLTATGIGQIAGKQSLKPGGSEGEGDEPQTQEIEQVTASGGISGSVGEGANKEELLRDAPAEGLLVNKHPKAAVADSVSATASNADIGRRLRLEQRLLLPTVQVKLTRIGDILQVSENVARYSRQLLTHAMNRFRMPKEPPELVTMVVITLSLVASEQLGQVVEHLPAISLVGKTLNMTLRKEDFPPVYAKVVAINESFVSHLSAPQGANCEEILPDEVAHSTIPQPASVGPESAVHIPPTPEASPSTMSNSHPSGGQQVCMDEIDSTQNCEVPASTPDTARLPQDDLLRTELEQSEQRRQAGNCEVTGVEDADPTLKALSAQEPLARTPQATVGVGLQGQAVAVSSEPLPVEAICARLKLQRDQLLHSSVDKQKMEVQEFNLSGARERQIRQKYFEKQKEKILAISGNFQQRAVMLSDLADVFESTQKLSEREADDRGQVMHLKQRDLRDRINALYTKLLQQVNSGTPADFLSEARRIGLASVVQFQTPELVEQGPMDTCHQIVVPQVEQNAMPRPLPDQHADPGTLPSILRTQIRPRLQHEAQPQSQWDIHLSAPNSQPQFQTQPLAQDSGVLRQGQDQFRGEPRPHAQHVDVRQSSPVTTFSESASQFVTHNIDRDVSEELVAAQLQRANILLPQRPQGHSRQQGMHTTEIVQPSGSHLSILESSHNTVRSEPLLASSRQGLERIESGAEQGGLQAPVTEHARVSELIRSFQEPVISHTPQTLQSRGSQTVQIPVNVQPRVAQIVHTPNVQGRISESVQASPNLQHRVPHTVVHLPAQGSQTVDAATNLQPRSSQIRRPLMNTRQPHPHYNPSAHQVRVQPPPLQQPHGQGFSFPNGSPTVGGTFVASQTGANVHSQNVPLGAYSSQVPFAPDPFAVEENRIKREQEKAKVFYNEETTQIRLQYDKEATELRRRYEGLLLERARVFEYRTTVMKENFEKIDRNRQLAENLKKRTAMDQQQKARQNPGHSSEIISGSAQGARSPALVAQISGRGHLQPSYQTNVVHATGRNMGRGFVGAGMNPGSAPVGMTFVGTPNSTSEGINAGSRIAQSQSFRSSNRQPAGFNSGGPVDSVMPNSMPQPPVSFSSTGFVSVLDSFTQTNPLLSNASVPLSNSSERVRHQVHSTSSSHIQVGRPWSSSQDGSENVMVPTSSFQAEQVASQWNNSGLSTVLATAPANSMRPPVSSPNLTETVIESASAASALPISTTLSLPAVAEAPVNSILPPVRIPSRNIEYAGNLFSQGQQNNLGGGTLSAEDFNDLLMPLPGENQVAEFEELGVPSQGQRASASAQPSTGATNHSLQTPLINFVYLSDDE